MSYPPPGYDDESVIPQQHLKNLLDHVEVDLSKIQTVFEQHITESVPLDLDETWRGLRASADELGPDFTFLVEKLITDYEHFRDEPDQSKLDQLFSDVKSLQLFLVG